MLNRETLYQRLLAAYTDRCCYLSECMDNYLNPFLGLKEEQLFRGGILELIKGGRHVEAKIMLRLISADISLDELFKAIEGGLENPVSEEELEAFLNERRSREPPNIEIPF